MRSEAGRREWGFSLAEALVTLMIVGLVTSAVLAGSRAVYRAYRYSDEDSDALGSLRTAVDRLEKEVRQARGFYADSDSVTAHFWVDFDLDNEEDLSEKIQWELVQVGSEAELRRTTDAAAAPVVTIARDLVWQGTFSYDTVDPASASVLTMTFVADAQAGGLARERTVRTAIRLRNAPG